MALERYEIVKKVPNQAKQRASFFTYTGCATVTQVKADTINLAENPLS
jgi:hypothetical protein